MRVNAKINEKDIRKVLAKAGKEGARKLRADVGSDVEKVTLGAANKASEEAPVDTGALRNSITASVEQAAPLSWTFGSDLPYATRQEYENDAHKGFFRKGLWQGRKDLRGRIEASIRKRGVL